MRFGKTLPLAIDLWCREERLRGLSASVAIDVQLYYHAAAVFARELQRFVDAFAKFAEIAIAEQVKARRG